MKAALPDSFRNALKAGWSIVKEETVASSDERQRTSVLLLGRKNVATRLRVAYTATTKSWTFEPPEAIEETLTA
jgi:hypothetical protein